MITKEMVDDFLAQRTLAIVGVSRTNPSKFGNAAYRELRDKGYQVFIVHPSGETIEGVQSYPSLKDLPQEVGGLLVVVPPEQTEKVVVQAHEAGIRRVWMQPGAESQTAIQYCEQHGVSVIYGQCILMFAQPQKFFHKPHRWIMKGLGKLPK